MSLVPAVAPGLLWAIERWPFRDEPPSAEVASILPDLDPADHISTGRPDFSRGGVARGQIVHGCPISIGSRDFSETGPCRFHVESCGSPRIACGRGYGGAPGGFVRATLCPTGIAAFGRFASGFPGFSEGAPSVAKIDPYRSEVGARGYFSPANLQPPSLRASWLRIPRVVPIFSRGGGRARLDFEGGRFSRASLSGK